MNKMLVAVLSMSALAISTSSMAADDNSTQTASAAGLYINADAGYGFFNIKDKADGVKDNGFAFGGDIGYQFNQYLAAEAGYIHLPNVKSNDTGSKISTYTIYGAVKGIYPINEHFDVFAKAGAGYLHRSSNGGDKESKWTPIVAAGADYNINSSFGVGVEALYTFKVSDVPASLTGLVSLNYKIAL